MKKLGIGLLAAASVLAGTLGMATPAIAAPAVTRPVMYTAEHAGAMVAATNVHYRYVETTFSLPRSVALPYSTGGMLSVQLRSPGEVFQLGIFAKPGTYWNAQALDVQPATSTNPANIEFKKVDSQLMKAGDVITLSLFYNASNGFLYFNATDHTSGATFAGRFSDPGALFGSARVGAEFATVPGGVPGSAFIRPLGDYRLAVLNATKITQLNGTRVSLEGSTQLVETSNGMRTGRVQVNAPVVYNDGMSTGIWVRH